MKHASLAAIAVLSALAGAPAAHAQQLPFRCGPDCSTPGRYVLCGDSFDDTMATGGGLRLADFLEAACKRFEAPAPSFSLVGFAALFGPGDMAVLLLEAFKDPNARGAPGPMIAEQGVGIQGGADIGFSGLEIAAVTATTAIRICLRQQLDDAAQTATIRELRLDADGADTNNFTFVPNMGWAEATSRGVRGDFVIRAVVRYADLTPWQAGGVCAQQPRPDGGVVVLPDAAPTTDSGPIAGMDAAPQATDSGAVAPPPDAGTSGGAAPAITLISPREGSNAAPVDIIVTGTGFAQGLSLKIGTIAAEMVEVPGATTIIARVPANIAPGTYDVIVRNPDNQTAVLPMGYKVIGQTTGDPPKSGGCSCAAAPASAPRGSAALAFALLAVLLLARGRRRLARERVLPARGPAGGSGSARPA